MCKCRRERSSVILQNCSWFVSLLAKRASSLSHRLVSLLSWFTLPSVTYLARASLLLLAGSTQHLENCLARVFASSAIPGWHNAGTASCGLLLVCPQREGHNERTLQGLGWAGGVPIPGNLASSSFCVGSCSRVWGVWVCLVQTQYSQNGRIWTALQNQYFLHLGVWLQLQGFLNLEAFYANGIELESESETPAW